MAEAAQMLDDFGSMMIVSQIFRIFSFQNMDLNPSRWRMLKIFSQHSFLMAGPWAGDAGRLSPLHCPRSAIPSSSLTERLKSPGTSQLSAGPMIYSRTCSFVTRSIGRIPLGSKAPSLNINECSRPDVATRNNIEAIQYGQRSFC